MIDWLTFTAEVSTHDVMQNGAVCKFNSDGSTEWASPARLELAGSYESSIYVRSKDANLIEISGNIVKHFQGHNLWGSGDLLGLAMYASVYVTDLLGLELYGIESISRADISVLVNMGSQGAVSEYVRYLGQAATVVQRGRGSLVGDSTVYFGQRSRRWSLKIYNKQAEVLATKSVFDVEKTAEIAAGKLRVEVVLRSPELKRLGLNKFSGWAIFDIAMKLREFLDKLVVPDQNPRVAWEKMPKAVRGTFMEWAQGDDIRKSVSKPTFYRHRRVILDALQVDIAAPPLEKITHIDELLARYGSVKQFPRLAEMPFWEPSEAQRAMLPTFDPVEALNSAMGLDRA